MNIIIPQVFPSVLENDMTELRGFRAHSMVFVGMGVTVVAQEMILN